MSILYIHHSVPGQFLNLIQHLAPRVRPRSTFLAVQDNSAFTVVDKQFYRPDTVGTPGDRALQPVANLLGHARAAGRKLRQLADSGLEPRLVIAHAGWGGALPLREVFPDVPLITYCEFFRGGGTTADAMQTWHLQAALDQSAAGVSPTHWQRSTFPAAHQPMIRVIHDGVDTRRLHPDPLARFELPDLTMLSARDKIVTYVARGLEPIRGFPEFLYAVPRILGQVPDAKVVIVGGDRAQYGPEPEGGGSHRAALLRDMGLSDPRVHFLGRVRYADFIRLMQITTAHVYSSRPFVLSWSLIEAMSLGAVIVGARNAAVEEVIEHGYNGLLANAADPNDLAARVVDVLRDPPAFAYLSQAARETAIARFDLSRCMPAWLDLMREVAPRIV
ncbi:glycosyl transferase [Allostella sp. ATCC 35155]|nr:glycosyl transferase [Stella sp. ATCC 35155]